MVSARTKLNSLKKLAASKFSESAHPRYPKGHPMGGKFMPKSVAAVDISAPIPIKMQGGADGVKKGRKTTTLLELSAIGADETGELYSNELTRLISVRNGFDSFEDFLQASPTGEPQLLFVGARVRMLAASSGSIVFTVDRSSSVQLGHTSIKPSRELIEMQQIFDTYLKSKAGNRMLSCNPVLDTSERFNTRIKHYAKNGFVSAGDLPGLPINEVPLLNLENPMFLDNRKNPQTFVEIKDYIDSPTAEARGILK